MAKRRTKKHKQIASLKRQLKKLNTAEASVSIEDQNIIKAKKASKKKIENKATIKHLSQKTGHQNIYHYDPSLIVGDLKKTLILSFIFLFFIGMLYYILELNGAQTIHQIIPFI